MTLEEKVLEGLDKGWKLEYLKEKISEGITEERVRDGILNDVRQDAFKKLKSAMRMPAFSSMRHCIS